jgi:hypothetical protein
LRVENEGGGGGDGDDDNDVVVENDLCNALLGQLWNYGGSGAAAA